MYERLTDKETGLLMDDASRSGKYMECKEQTGAYSKDLLEKAILQLSAYEDIEKSPEEIISSLEDYKDVSQQYANFVHEMQPLKEAQAEGRLVVLPEGFENALAKGEKFYHAVYMPRVCNEDHCEDCKFAAPDDCRFKPHVVEVSSQRVASAVYDIADLKLTHEAAEKALGGAEDGSSKDE